MHACEARLVALAGPAEHQHAGGLKVLQLRPRHHRPHLVSHLRDDVASTSTLCQKAGKFFKTLAPLQQCADSEGWEGRAAHGV